MAANFLKHNDDKTEPILIGNLKRFSKIHDLELSIGNIRVKPSAYSRNLGVYFHSTLSFKSLIPKTDATATFPIRSLDAIRDHLP